MSDQTTENQAMMNSSVDTPGNLRLFSESIGLGSFSIDVFNQLANGQQEIIPEGSNSPPTPLKQTEQTSNKMLLNTQNPQSEPLNDNFKVMQTEEVPSPPEKKQKLHHHFVTPVTTDFREWSKWDHPTSYTLTFKFGDPDRPVPPTLKNCKKSIILDYLIERHFPEAMRQGLKSELIHKLQFDLPTLTLQIEGREDLSRCLAAVFAAWDWPLDLTYSATLPFHGYNVLGVKHYHDIFGPYFFDTQYNISNPNHMRLIRAAIRRELPCLSIPEQEALTMKIGQNHLRGEVLSEVRQVAGCANLSGHRYRETNGHERTFYLDLNTLALQEGDKVEFKVPYAGKSVVLLMYVDAVHHNMPLIPEVKLKEPVTPATTTNLSAASSLPTRARILTHSWHQFPKPVDVQFVQVPLAHTSSTETDEGVDREKIAHKQPLAAARNHTKKKQVLILQRNPNANKSQQIINAISSEENEAGDMTNHQQDNYVQNSSSKQEGNEGKSSLLQPMKSDEEGTAKSMMVHNNNNNNNNNNNIHANISEDSNNKAVDNTNSSRNDNSHNNTSFKSISDDYMNSTISE